MTSRLNHVILAHDTPGTSSHPGAAPTGLSRSGFRFGVVLLTFAYLTWVFAWAFTSAPFRTPDEPAHYNSILRIAYGTGDRWPAPGDAYMYRDVLDAARESGVRKIGAEDFNHRSRTPLSQAAEWSFYDTPVVSHTDRTVPRATVTADVTDQMTQHPPLYYAMAAGVLRIAGAQNWHWDSQLLLLRGFSALLTLPLVPCLAFTLRRIGVGRAAALVGASAVFLVPQLALVSGSVTNDTLAVGAGALTIAACAAAMFTPGRRTILWAGLALGLALWTKGTLIPLGLVVFLSFVLNPRRGTLMRRAGQGIAAGLIGLAVGGWWWARNLLLYGALQPDGYGRTAVNSGGTMSLPAFIWRSWRELTNSFWGDLGWVERRLPVGLLWPLIYGAVLLTGIALVRHAEKRWRLLNLDLFTVALWLVLFIQAWHQYRALGTISGLQGRYLFPDMVGILAVCMMGWLGRRSPVPRWRLGAAGLLSVAVAVYGYVFWVRNLYPAGATGVDVERWAAVIGLPTGALAAVVAGASLAVLVLLGVVIVAAQLEPTMAHSGTTRPVDVIERAGATSSNPQGTGQPTAAG